MFLLDNLLAAPGNGLMFVFKELARKAQDEWLDDDGLKKELQEMYALFEAGRISEREFEEKEYRIVERLQQIAKAKYQQKWGLDRESDDREPAPQLDVESEIIVAPLLPSVDAVPPPAEIPSRYEPVPALPSPSMPAPASAPPAAPPDAMVVTAPAAAVARPDTVTTISTPDTVTQSLRPETVTPASRPDSVTPASAPLTLKQAIDSALHGLSMLNLKVSSVTSVTRAEDGWQVTAELVERRSVPDTSDLLGLYELRLDEAGNVLRWERTRMRRRCDLGR